MFEMVIIMQNDHMSNNPTIYIFSYCSGESMTHSQISVCSFLQIGHSLIGKVGHYGPGGGQFSAGKILVKFKVMPYVVKAEK